MKALNDLEDVILTPPSPPPTPAYGVSLQVATTWQWFVAASSSIRQRRRIRVGSTFTGRSSMTTRLRSSLLRRGLSHGAGGRRNSGSPAAMPRHIPGLTPRPGIYLS